MMGFLDDAVLFAGVLVTGGAMSGAQSQRQANAVNIQEAQKNRDFQERMSNTSYQRGMTDMKAAGLNPILAMSKGGASAPTGAQAVVQGARSGAGALAKGIGDGARNFVQLQNTVKDTQLKKSSSNAQNKSADLTTSKNETEQHTAKKIKNEAKVAENERKVSDAQQASRIKNARISGAGRDAGHGNKQALELGEALNQMIEGTYNKANEYGRKGNNWIKDKYNKSEKMFKKHFDFN